MGFSGAKYVSSSTFCLLSFTYSVQISGYKSCKYFQLNIDILYLLFQFRRDVEDEKLWIAEKMPLATSTDYGNSLFNVHTLKKKNQVYFFLIKNS